MTIVGSGMVDGRKIEPISLARLVAVTAAKIVRGGGGIRLTGEFLLIGVAAEVIFLFEEQPIFAAEEIGGGETGHATTDDGDIHYAGGVGFGEGVAVADFVADGEMFAFDVGRFGVRICQKSFVDGTAGGDGTSDQEFDEIAARVGRS